MKTQLFWLLLLIQLISFNNLCAQNEVYRPSIQDREVRKIQTRLPFNSYKQNASSTVNVEVVNEIAIMEGDIILGNINTITAGMGVIATDGSRDRWPGGQMPFAIDNTFSAEKITEINDAVQELNSKTNLFLYPRTGEVDYIMFIPSTGCSSYVGRQGKGQVIELAPGCGKASIMHEILHSAGLYHEQSRGDRDDFVEILWENIEENNKHNFEQHSSSASDIGNYDFGSVMHYGQYAFGKIDDGKTLQTIKCKSPCSNMGQRTSLSIPDINGINSIYP